MNEGKFQRTSSLYKGPLNLASNDKDFVYLSGAKTLMIRKTQQEEAKSQEKKQKVEVKDDKQFDVSNLTIKDIEQFDALMKGVAVPSIANTNNFGSNNDK